MTVAPAVFHTTLTTFAATAIPSTMTGEPSGVRLAGNASLRGNRDVTCGAMLLEASLEEVKRIPD